MAGSTTPAQGFPQISLPFVTPAGNITQTWLQLLISLWNRTGAGSGQQPAAPSGTISSFAGTTLPSGWLLCDGSTVSRSTYSTLFAAIGTTWGPGDGSSTFNLPNFVNKFLVGAGGLYAAGTYGGEPTVTLGIGNLPAHNHPVIDPGHAHAITDPGHHHASVVADSISTTGTNAGGSTAGNTGTSTTGITVDTAVTGITTGDTGSGTAFPIIPPYAAVLPMIKT